MQVLDSTRGILAEIKYSIQPTLDAALWRRWRFPLALFLSLRIALAVWAVLVLNSLGSPLPALGNDFVGSSAEMYSGLSNAPIWSQAQQVLLAPWLRWDTVWYLKMAANGYAPTDGSAAFFPLYPLATLLLSLPLGGARLAAALLISNAAALAAFILLYEICQKNFGEQIARRTLLYWVAFPMAFFLVAGYTESLFVLWALLAFRSAQGGRWGWAGIWTGLAALTRLPGIVLFLPLWLVWFTEWRKQRARPAQFMRLLAPGIALASLFWLYLAFQFGDPAVWLKSMSSWRVPGYPGQGVVLVIQALLAGETFAIANNVIDLAATLFFLGMVVWAWRDLPLLFSSYAAAILALPLLSVQTVVPNLYLASMPRYGMVLFPIFIVLARHVPARWMRVILIPWILAQAFLSAFFFKGVWVA